MVRSSLGIGCVIAICVLGVVQVDAGNGGNQKCVCEEAGLVGAAFGACNRYCEDLNCDAPNPNGSANACNRVLDRFFDLTGELPPCEPLCPCAGGWLDSDFIPEGEVAASCSVEITDNGKRMELLVEGSEDGSGNAPLSVAAVDIFDDEDFGYYRVGCASEHYEGGQFEPSEDSGSFEMASDFNEKTEYFNRQQRRIFKSCKAVFKRTVKRTGVECEVFDLREE